VISNLTYAQAKQKAADRILAHRHLRLVANQEPVRRAAEGLADRNVMFSIMLRDHTEAGSPVGKATLEVFHDTDNVSPSRQDDWGNTWQFLRLRARISWPALEKEGATCSAWLQAKFLVAAAELADDVNVELIACGEVCELIQPARVPRDEASAA